MSPGKGFRKTVRLGRRAAKTRCIIFVAWGEDYIREVGECLRSSTQFPDYDLILITDRETELRTYAEALNRVIRVDFQLQGLLRKTEAFHYFPREYKSCLMLDSDTVILEDISYGFEVAEQHLVAVAPAPHYSLDHFWGFNKVMEREGVPCKGQLQYNTGVIFFKNCRRVRKLFQLWHRLAIRHSEQFKNDQPFFSLAMLKTGFNPHTLSISYNYRGYGDAISGVVRIWHSHEEMPADINVLDKPWPPRRAWPDRVEYP